MMDDCFTAHFIFLSNTKIVKIDVRFFLQIKENILRIEKWSIRSLSRKESKKSKNLRVLYIDVCALQETKKKGKGQSIIREYILIYSGVKKEQRAKEEVALMVQNKFKDQIVVGHYINHKG